MLLHRERHWRRGLGRVGCSTWASSRLSWASATSRSSAIDNHWVSEATRVIQGGVMGLLLIAGGLRFVREGYRATGQILTGCGIAILYVSVYAAFNFYDLIGQIAGLRSDVRRHDSGGVACAIVSGRKGLALVAVGGGFATPFLMPTSLDAVALFGYDTFLIAGTMWLARTTRLASAQRRELRVHGADGVVLGGLFYKPAEYLTTELFLTLFCAMFLFILYADGGSSTSTCPSGTGDSVDRAGPLLHVVARDPVESLCGAARVPGIACAGRSTVGSRAGSWVRLDFCSPSLRRCCSGAMRTPDSKLAGRRPGGVGRRLHAEPRGPARGDGRTRTVVCRRRHRAAASQWPGRISQALIC